MRKLLITGALALGLVAGAAARANAQVQLTPFAGVTFGSDAPASKFSTGAGLTVMGRIVGFELDFGYTPDFFDENPDFTFVGDSNVTTLMGNVIIAVPAGRVQPYGLFGVGLVRSRIGDAEDLFDDVTTNDFGLSVGGGVLGMVSNHIGLRGDIRYLRSLQDNEPDNDLDIAIGKFGFWRATAGLTFKF
jgi:opacity protein-like surface antigen